MSIGQNIRRLRKEHGLNQAQLGAIAGVTDKAVSTWEMDLKIPRMGAMQKMADYFGVSKSDLIEEPLPEDAPPELPSDAALKFALFGDPAVDDAVLEEVKRFAKYTQTQRGER